MGKRVPLREIYGKHIPRMYPGEPAPPSFRIARTKLGLVMRHPDARQMVHDLEFQHLPVHMQNKRMQTFLSLVQLAKQMNMHGNVNVQSGLKDLMQILGYTSVDKLIGEMPATTNPSLRSNIQLYLKTITGDLS